MTPALRSGLGVPVRVALAIVLANAPYWWLGQSRFLNRAVIDVDTLVALAVMALRPRWGVALLVLAWLLDAVVGLSLTYHFRSPLEFIHSIRFATTIDWRDFADPQLLVLLLPFAAALALLVPLIGRRRLAAFPLVAAAGLLVAVDALNGSSLLSTRDDWRAPVNIAGSPAATLGRLALQGNAPAPLRRLAKADTASALADLPQWAAEHPRGTMLLVVVESLGAPVEPALQAWLDERMHAPGHQVRAGQVPSQGSTTAGELRTLCALAGHYRNLNTEAGSECLPSTLARMGWSTLGLHGFSARMFDRRSWWPRLGLQQTAFVDNPLLAQAGRCGSAFAGACDAEVLAAAAQWLRGGERRFAYVLTLNTHLPLVPVPVPPELQRRCEAHAVDADACRLTAALGGVLEAVSRQVAQAPQPLLALVVGDHPPPFNRREARAAFHQRQVPAYVLRPAD